MFIPAVLRVILLVISLLLFELSATISISEDPKIASFSLSQDILLLGETMLNAEPGEGMLYPGEWGEYLGELMMGEEYKGEPIIGEECKDELFEVKSLDDVMIGLINFG